MLHLCLVGHHRTIDISQNLIQQHFPHIITTQIQMDTMDITPVIPRIKTCESKVDGLLFTGKIPYDLINAEMISQKPWIYIRHDLSRLLSAFIEASYIHNYDITRISVDSYSEEDLNGIFENLHIDKKKLNLHISHNPIFHDSFLDDIKSFHENNFRTGSVSVCITGISDVYEYLKAKNIPCLPLDPTKQSIDNALQYFESKRQSNKHKESQIVVLAIERDLPDEHALIKENEYQLSLESMKIAEEIYLFSQRIQAAVVEKELGKYLLITTKYLLELETEQLQKINILTTRKVERFGTLSIGIGYGETAREAKYNANLGLIKAKKQGGNQAYRVENNQYIGPIIPAPADKDSSYNIDGPFQHIATETGISLNSILKFQTIIDQQKNDVFTPKELATLYGISLRSMNRILEKLLDTNYAEIIGCNMRTAHGRPSRIIKLCLSMQDQGT